MEKWQRKKKERIERDKRWKKLMDKKQIMRWLKGE